MVMDKGADGKDDPNTWCISDISQGRFDNFLTDFQGQTKYKLALSINLESFSACETDWARQFVTKFSTNVDDNELRFYNHDHHSGGGGPSGGSSGAHSGDGPGGSSSGSGGKCCCYLVVAIILLAGAGFGVWWFKFRDDAAGGGIFSKI